MRLPAVVSSELLSSIYEQSSGLAYLGTVRRKTSGTDSRNPGLIDTAASETQVDTQCLDKSLAFHEPKEWPTAKTPLIRQLTW